MIIADQREKRFNKKVTKLTKTFGEEIYTQLTKVSNNMKLSYYEIYSIERKLNNKVYQRVFNNTIISFNEEANNYPYVEKYMTKFDDYIQKLIKKRKNEGSIKNVYTVFLLGQFKVDLGYINDYLKDSLKTTSLHLRFNALNSISQIGNVDCFIEALTYLSETQGYINEKVFIDIMDHFGGDIEELNVKLLQCLDDFSIEIQCIIIEHWQNRMNQSVAGHLLEKLKEPDADKEIETSIIKYFNRINYPPAKEVLIELLGSEYWECRALVAKTLSNYYSYDTIDKLLISIMDSNWYVRLNSAMTLLDFDLGNMLIYDVLHKKDKYSRDILFYAMFVKNKITYDEYMEKTNGRRRW